MDGCEGHECFWNILKREDGSGGGEGMLFLICSGMSCVGISVIICSGLDVIPNRDLSLFWTLSEHQLPI